LESAVGDGDLHKPHHKQTPGGPAMAATIPATWMPDADMRRIHIHWTAGRHKANATDLASYHVLIEGDGK
jgi:hypothetical protein